MMMLEAAVRSGCAIWSRLRTGALLLAAPIVASAQQVPLLYPTKVYVGDNVVTIRSSKGIESIRATPTHNVTAITPPISGCPTEAQIRIRVATATDAQGIDLLIHYCDGSFRTETIQRENWTIRHERTGPVDVGRDTCLRCEIVTPTGKIVDSIVVPDSRFHVEIPGGAGPWNAPPSEQGRPSLNYTVCYRPAGVEIIEQKILLYIRRDQPNGGLTQYVIEKPISAIGALPIEQTIPPLLSRRDSLRRLEELLPPLVDPTTFRTVLVPTAETLDHGDLFVGSVDVAGVLAGYGVSDDLTVIAGGAFVPSFIQDVSVLSIGLKGRVVQEGGVQAGIGAQIALSSGTESTIRLAAPFAVVSYGDRASRLSAGIGYAWKKHRLSEGMEFNRNAVIATLGGDLTIDRGWKLAAEAYYIESSGLAPLTMTARWFNASLAIDFGFMIDLGGGNDIRSTGPLTGEITDLRIVPLLSAIWRFRS